jgi:hypothetical protein
MSDVEEIIKEIAIKHGIGVGRDDPIMILHTINKRLMDDSAKAQQEMLDHYKEELEDLAKRWGDDTKAKAERILNAALAASREMMAKAAQEAAAMVKKTVEQEVETSLKKLQEPMHNTRILVVANVIAAAITLIVALAALLALR